MKTVIIVLLVIIAISIVGGIIIGRRIVGSATRGSTPTKVAEITPAPSEPETPTDCTSDATPQVAEGPYYRAGSPERDNFIEPGIPTADKVTITGFVYDFSCTPVPDARLDFWQADESGRYDTTGYRLRGHQFTDQEGKYTLVTIKPAGYSGRPPHIHVKIQAAPTSPEIITQLYFPYETGNSSDSLYNDRLLLSRENNEHIFSFTVPR